MSKADMLRTLRLKPTSTSAGLEMCNGQNCQIQTDSVGSHCKVCGWDDIPMGGGPDYTNATAFVYMLFELYNKHRSDRAAVNRELGRTIQLSGLSFRSDELQFKFFNHISIGAYTQYDYWSLLCFECMAFHITRKI